MTPIRPFPCRKTKTGWPKIARTVCLALLLGFQISNPHSAAAKRRFTVADDIAFAHFGDPYSGLAEAITFSPDGNFFVTDTERGRLELNRPESKLRVYRTTDVLRYLLRPRGCRAPSPVLIVRKATYRQGPIITHIHWLPDSSAVAFLAKTSHGNDRLFLADIRSGRLGALTPYRQHVTGFDIRNRNHFIYTVLDLTADKRVRRERRTPTIVGTGRSLDSILFPEDLYPAMFRSSDSDTLWAVVGNRRFRVEDKSSGQHICIDQEGQQSLSLSPDGSFVATVLRVKFLSPNWRQLYRAPSSSTRADNAEDTRGVSEYVRIGLLNGTVKRLTLAPTGNAAGWFGTTHADWSPDGKSVLLTNTFLPSGDENPNNRPCVAVVDVRSGQATCVERTRAMRSDGSYESDHHFVLDARFASDAQHIIVHYLCPDGSRASANYVLTSSGAWIIKSQATGAAEEPRRINVSIKQGLNKPPLLVATDTTTNVSRTILNPNPQLKDIDFGEASVFRWQDKTGRNWTGGLYLPPNYVPGNRYPLVIQTHGFVDNDFRPSGIYPTAFAARELAARGILVLQVRDCSIRLTPDEGPCQVRGYESAVERLAAEGLIDPNRVGIVGFSRTCYYVLEALETGALHFKAASITDGVNEGYLQYITGVDQVDNGFAREADRIIGSRPFGGGLHLWLQKSPPFNMDKINVPIQVVALGRDDLLFMWEPYAVLRYLEKPVDLIVLTQDATHVLTNPAQRMISQGGTVDWFCFWLNDEKDPNPTKAAQYSRWHRLRALQESNERQPESVQGAPRD